MTHFLKEYVKDPRMTGTICPSSKYLAEAMTKINNLQSANVVVELGPGSGAITKKIIAKISKDCTFFALELNPNLAQELKEKYPNLQVYPDSATNIQKYLQKHKVKNCDTVVSSLPWSLLNQETQEKILTEIDASLSPRGKLITYSYLTAKIMSQQKNFLKLLKQHFPNIQKRIVWKNIPPAMVYECKK